MTECDPRYKQNRSFIGTALEIIIEQIDFASLVEFLEEYQT